MLPGVFAPKAAQPVPNLANRDAFFIAKPAYLQTGLYRIRDMRYLTAFAKVVGSVPIYRFGSQYLLSILLKARPEHVGVRQGMMD